MPFRMSKEMRASNVDVSLLNCGHDPCARNEVCVDELVPVSCFASPCPQFSCFKTL